MQYCKFYGIGDFILVFIFLKYLFICFYFWLCWDLHAKINEEVHGLFVAAHGLLSSCGAWAQ